MGRAKITLRANFEIGSGSIGNVEKFSAENSGLMRADIIKDWIYDLQIQYDIAIEDMRSELGFKPKEYAETE